jgi:Zn-dependent peptidase ImmA (M78 family)
MTMTMPGIEVPTSPGVLIWARETAGLSLEDAAKRIREEPSDLDAVERGQKQLSLGVARELARAYRRPLAALMLPAQPVEADRPADFRVGVGGRLGPDARLAIRRAERLQGLAAELFEALDNPSAWRRGTVAADADPVNTAAAVRKILPYSIADQRGWKDEYHALRSWREALGATGILVLQASMPLDDVRGFSLASDGPITIVVNSRDYVLARVFTLFHELIHQLLGTGGICLPDPGRDSSGGIQAAETFCNRVAGNILVPSDALESDEEVHRLTRAGVLAQESSVNRLARRYWVSRPALWFRLREEGLVNEDAYRSLWARWAARPAPGRSKPGAPPKVSTARRVLSEVGPRFVTSVIEAYDRGLLGLGDAVEFLDVSVQDVAKLEHLTTDVHG